MNASRARIAKRVPINNTHSLCIVCVHLCGTCVHACGMYVRVCVHVRVCLCVNVTSAFRIQKRRLTNIRMCMREQHSKAEQERARNTCLTSSLSYTMLCTYMLQEMNTRMSQCTQHVHIHIHIHIHYFYAVCEYAHVTTHTTHLPGQLAVEQS